MIGDSSEISQNISRNVIRGNRKAGDGGGGGKDGVVVGMGVLARSLSTTWHSAGVHQWMSCVSIDIPQDLLSRGISIALVVHSVDPIQSLDPLEWGIATWRSLLQRVSLYRRMILQRLVRSAHPTVTAFASSTETPSGQDDLLPNVGRGLYCHPRLHRPRTGRTGLAIWSLELP